MSKWFRRAAPGVMLLWGCLASPVALSNDTALTLQQGTDLVKRSACLGCHLVDKKRLGPGFVQIAQRYADQPDAVDHLVGAIRNGGAGKWGAVPMPAQRHVNPEDAGQIAVWILSLNPK